MPGFPFPGRPGGEHDEPLLDMIIARRVLPPDAPQPMHDLASMLAALAGPGRTWGAGRGGGSAGCLQPGSLSGLASHPPQGGAGGPAGFGVQLVPGPGWLRRWSSRRPRWAASSRPTSTSCPAPFSNSRTSRWRRLPRPAPARPGPSRARRRWPCTARASPAASPPPGRTTRRARLRSPARGPRRQTSSPARPGHPVTGPPGRPAARAWRTRRVRSRRRRGIRACPRGPLRSTAPASRPGRRPSPR